MKNRVGIFAGIPNAEYHAGPGISKSALDLIRRSPAHYRAARDAGPRVSTPDQRIGTIAHSLILEPRMFDDVYSAPFMPPDGAISTADEMKDRLKSAGEKTSGTKSELKARLAAIDPAAVFLDDERAAHAASVGDREIISADELAAARAMRDAVMAHPRAAKLLAPESGHAELSAFWTDLETGVLCRCRPDFWRGNGVVVDLKTTRDASPEGFSRSILQWRYHVQAAFYLDGLAAAVAQGRVDRHPPTAFVFVAVEKVAPFAVGVYAIDAESLEIGRRECREDLAAYAAAERTGIWPAYSADVETIGLPAWRLRQEQFEGEAA